MSDFLACWSAASAEKVESAFQPALRDLNTNTVVAAGDYPHAQNITAQSGLGDAAVSTNVGGFLRKRRPQ